MEKSYYIYLITNQKQNVLYVGVTNNLIRRIYEHKNKLMEGYTKKYNIYRLVYYEIFADITYAIEREKQIKGWSRKKKDALINKVNPQWDDLYEGLLQLGRDPSLALGMTIVAQDGAVASNDVTQLLDPVNLSSSGAFFATKDLNSSRPSGVCHPEERFLRRRISTLLDPRKSVIQRSVFCDEGSRRYREFWREGTSWNYDTQTDLIF